MLTKRTRGNQITLPKQLIQEARLHDGDVYFDITYKHGTFYLKPVSVTVEEKTSDEAFTTFAEAALKKARGDRTFRSASKAGEFLRRRIK